MTLCWREGSAEVMAQWTTVWFPAATLGVSQLPVTPSMGDLMLSSGLKDMCTQVHTYIQTDNK